MNEQKCTGTGINASNEADEGTDRDNELEESRQRRRNDRTRRTEEVTGDVGMRPAYERLCTATICVPRAPLYEWLNLTCVNSVLLSSGRASGSIPSSGSGHRGGARGAAWLYVMRLELLETRLERVEMTIGLLLLCRELVELVGQRTKRLHRFLHRPPSPAGSSAWPRSRPRGSSPTPATARATASGPPAAARSGRGRRRVCQASGHAASASVLNRS